MYDELSEEFGIHAEPIVLHSPAPDLLAGAWSVCRETLVAAGRVDRAVKESVAVAVSELNACPYCVDAHAAMLAGTKRAPAPEIQAAIQWARATRTPGAAVLAAPPFGPEEAPEMIGTAVLFHYVNRPVSVLLDDSPLPGASRLFKRGVVWVAGRRFRRFVRAAPTPGATVDLLPAAPLPPEFAWASASPAIADAWARFCAVVEDHGKAALPPAVRAAVARRLEHWVGEDPGLGLAWLDEALPRIHAADRPAGRLAMLAALAPYRVGEDVVREYLEANGDARLVAAVCWPALAAARRVAAWLGGAT